MCGFIRADKTDSYQLTLKPQQIRSKVNDELFSSLRLQRKILA
jgi:hypothetical protein